MRSATGDWDRCWAWERSSRSSSAWSYSTPGGSSTTPGLSVCFPWNGPLLFGSWSRFPADTWSLSATRPSTTYITSGCTTGRTLTGRVSYGRGRPAKGTTAACAAISRALGFGCCSRTSPNLVSNWSILEQNRIRHYAHRNPLWPGGNAGAAGHWLRACPLPADLSQSRRTRYPRPDRRRHCRERCAPTSTDIWVRPVDVPGLWRFFCNCVQEANPGVAYMACLGRAYRGVRDCRMDAAESVSDL